MEQAEFDIHKTLIIQAVNKVNQQTRVIICHNQYTEEQERVIDNLILRSNGVIIGRIPRTTDNIKKQAERLWRLIKDYHFKHGNHNYVVIGQFKPKNITPL